MDVAKLTMVYHVLTLLAHRNKNQHRRDGWWKWLSMWRRAVEKLILKSDDESVRMRIAFMTDRIFPNCYVSFTQLLADGQFSALGLVLLAELARTRSAVGSRHLDIEDILRRGQTTVGRVLTSECSLTEDVGEVLARPQDGGNLDFSAADAASVSGNVEDAAMAKLQQQAVDSEKQSTPPLPTPRGSMERASDRHTGVLTSLKPATRRMQRKQRRRPNSIDDLFEGLT